ncbi:adenosylcobinamide-phosphate synthase CbiB [Acidovorax sp. Leaf160]|uniref:adenosylcobinamide-phosphate synthase CbiB n=1 Tax=Acidovorax sp. Leaf160 TaxID=1736280 RepID=UPI0006FE1E33|nr:adenosylcobinamide-phosphate synthase CbiB [Acidovorax sp. Leaf160]KQR45901.1 cobalamin biosynthesis protein CobD [Acidovorax sp. Leaf160]
MLEPSQAPWVLAAAVPLALLIDRLFGEPPAALHPVVWMGHALQWGGDRVAPTAPTGRDWKCFWQAALIWCLLAGAVSIVAAGVQWWLLHHAPAWAAAALIALLLKPLLAWRMLRTEVLAVEAGLADSLDAGRARLARLVSRDVSVLDAVQVRESAIESLAENLNDSVVAPLFWFALLGLPGAALYRFANTADAMWGYPGMRGGRWWQWAGKWAARADDVLSWAPARLTALLLWCLAPRRGTPTTWQRLRAEARRTPSPNSGWPMAAMALALGVRLAKPQVYTLNADGRAAGPTDTYHAAHWASKVVVALIPIALIAIFMIAVLPWR